MTPLRLAVTSLRARLVRSLLLAALVAIALTTAMTLFILSRGIERSISDGVSERGADLSVMQKDAADVLSGYLPETMGAAIAATPGVAGVTGELVMFAPVENGRQLIVFGWSEGGHFWRNQRYARGGAGAQDATRPAVIGAAVADSLRKDVGDSIEIFGEVFTIAGISEARSAFNRSIIILRAADLQDIAIRRGQVTLYHVALDANARRNPAPVVAALERLGRVSVTQADDLLRNDRNYAILKAVSRAVSVIAAVMGALTLLSVLLMAVHERRRDIGVLMAIGWSERRIMSSIVAEGACVGLIGGALAAPLSIVSAQLLARLPGLGEFLDLSAPPDLLAAGVALATMVCAVGALYPAWTATRLKPVECLRAV